MSKNNTNSIKRLVKSIINMAINKNFAINYHPKKDSITIYKVSEDGKNITHSNHGFSGVPSSLYNLKKFIKDFKE